MNRLTNEQRLQIIELYYQNSCSVKNVFRKLRPIYGRHNRPTEQAIRAIVTKFGTSSTLLDSNPPTRMRRVRTEENIAAVSDSVNEDRDMSIRRRSQQLGLCCSTTWKILRKDLGIKPYRDDVENDEESPTTSTAALAKKRSAAGNEDSSIIKRSKRKVLIQDNATKVLSTPIKTAGGGRVRKVVALKAQITPASQVEVKEEQEDVPKRATRKK